MSRTLGTRHGAPCGCEPDLASDQQLRSIIALGASPGDALSDRADARQTRLELRRSYGCDCCGDVDPKLRVQPEITATVRAAIESWTGTACTTCPWRAMYDPRVARVIEAWRWFDKGQFAAAYPEPTHWLVQAVAFFQQVWTSMEAAEREMERKERAGRKPNHV